MTKRARRQHFVSRFYLRNFAEPMFTDTLQVYERKKGCWERRTPKGVGWAPHLYTMTGMDGCRTDEFDLFLKQKVEDPAAPALKKMAQSHRTNEQEQSAIALFIGLTAARSPDMMKQIPAKYVQKLSDSERQELDVITRAWCERTGQKYETNLNTEILKPDIFLSMWRWAKSLQHRFLHWQWDIRQTTRDKPFVTSDRPVFMMWDQKQDIRFVSFPVSSEVALIISNNVGRPRENPDHEQEVRDMNRRTMDRANDFIAACDRSFPGDSFLPEWQARETV